MDLSTLFRKLPISEYVVICDIYEYVVMYYVSISIKYAVLWDHLRVTTSLHPQCAHDDVSGSWWHAGVSLRVSSVRHSKPRRSALNSGAFSSAPCSPWSAIARSSVITRSRQAIVTREKNGLFIAVSNCTQVRGKNLLNLKVLDYLGLKCPLFTCSSMSQVFKISP